MNRQLISDSIERIIERSTEEDELVFYVERKDVSLMNYVDEIRLELKKIEWLLYVNKLLSTQDVDNSVENCEKVQEAQQE